MKNYIFDVDGTLTPSRGKIDEKFLKWFLEFNKGNNVYLVTGSDRYKTEEQIGETLYAKVNAVYNSSGNTKHKKGVCVFNTRNLELPRDAYAFLLKKSISSKWEPKTGLHFDTRPGLLKFSILGRNATKAQRKKYVKFDNATNDRQIISDEFNKKFTKKFGLISQVAGETGLDIIEIGKDKAMILKDFTFQDELVFFGDNIQPGGNDYGIAQVIEYGPYDSGNVHHVKNWKETWKILKKYDIH
ncbi:MAG: HAD-IIB family hydrolase [Candidatus Endolissoclinum sp.]|nr:HAD-IIB family hydrolase [Candidatus Endolissoclinum sp.]